MSVTSVLEKLDELIVKTDIADLSELANGLLEKAPKVRGRDIKDVIASGHRRYPHLVPMYRTVHRKIPRPMVFRAIRWVNPKRMFPGAGLTKEEMQKMSPEALKELAVTLNTYREEAHVIHNRYNQMIWLIERGQSPYFIPYANIKEPKWLVLEGYMARAERLKNGTMAWEHTLDQQAQDLRSVLLQEDKGKVKFDDIDGLWIDPNGKARAPMFMDVKSKGAAEPLRKQRTVNGERLKVQPQAFARLFIGVHPDEVRVGEEVRMPHEGKYINPDWIGNREKRILARDMGEAGMFLARIPKAPIQIAQAKRKEFAERGQLLTIPAGRKKNPVFIVFDNVPAADVANRRWQRVTQPERGGRHPTGAPLSGRMGVHRAPPAAEVQAFPQRRDLPPPRRRRTDPVSRASQIQGNEAEVRARQADAADRQNGLGNKKIRDSFTQANAARDELLKKWNRPLSLFGDAPVDPTQQNPEIAGFTNGDVKGQKTPKPFNQGGGIRGTTNFTVQVGGKPYIYKIFHEDSRGEMFSFMVDRALGLDSVPAIYAHQYGLDGMRTAFDATHGAGALGNQYGESGREARKGGGHLMEFCVDCSRAGNEESDAILKKMVQTKEGRNEFNKLSMIDFITGNHDRHGANWMVRPDGKIIAIDNAYSSWQREPLFDQAKTIAAGRAGGFKGVEAHWKVVDENGKQVRDANGNAVPDTKADWSGVRAENGAAITEDLVKQEAGEFFDEHFNAEALQEGAKAINVSLSGLNNVVQLRDKFIKQSATNFSLPQGWGRNLDKPNPN